MDFLLKFLSRKWLTAIVAGLAIPLLAGFIPKLAETLLRLWPYVLGGYLLIALWIVLEWRSDMARNLPKDPEKAAERIIKMKQALSDKIEPELLEDIVLAYAKSMFCGVPRGERHKEH